MSAIHTFRLEGHELRSAAVNVSSSGNNTIVAGISGVSIVVLQYWLVAAGAVSVTWQTSGGTVKDGPMPFAANGGYAPSFNAKGYYALPLGEGLVLNLSAAVQVGGFVRYLIMS